MEGGGGSGERKDTGLVPGVMLAVVVVWRPREGKSDVVHRILTDRNIHPKTARCGLMGKLFMNYLQCT